MARPINILKTVNLNVAASEPMIENLKELALTGLFGKSANETAERLIAKGILDLQKEGYIKKRKAKKTQTK